MITARDLAFGYPGGDPVVDGVSLEVVPGRLLGIIGPNGSGKSTLLRLLYRALRPQRGTILLDGLRLDRLPRHEIARRVAVVTQEEASELPVTVLEMVLLGRAPQRGDLRRYTEEDYRIAGEALEHVGARSLADRRCNQLSGGERRRVLIARALAQRTETLLLDEPTNHLDIHYQHQLLSLVRSAELACAVVLHDLNLAARYCDQLLLLDRGSVVSSGTPREVLRPEIIERVYRIGVRAIEDGDAVQLVFAPPSSGR